MTQINERIFLISLLPLPFDLILQYALEKSNQIIKNQGIIYDNK